MKDLEAAQSQPGCVPAATTSGSEPSAAFTPGPWGHPTWNAAAACVSVSLTGQPFDCWKSPGGSVFRERDMADGHLISAAPALYHALRKARLFLEDDPTRAPSPLLFLVAEIDAALARVEGRSALSKSEGDAS